MIRGLSSTYQCLNSRVSLYASQRWASTTAAIKKGLRATQEESRPRRSERIVLGPSKNNSSKPSIRSASRSPPSTGSRRQDRTVKHAANNYERGSRGSTRDSPRPNDALSHLKPSGRNDTHSSRRQSSQTSKVSVARDEPGRTSRRSNEKDPRSQHRRRDEVVSSRETYQQRSTSQEGSFQKRMRDRPSRAANAKSASGQESSSGGLLRQVKTACKLVQTIQLGESSGEDVSDVLEKLESHLHGINAFVESGSFRDQPSEAVAAIMEKHAAHETFSRQYKSTSKRTIITQKPNGRLAISVGQGGPSESSASGQATTNHRHASREVESSRLDNRSKADERSDRRAALRSKEDNEDEDDVIPLPLPYSSAASEFLYGYNTVLAALRAKRRKMYKLYIHPKIFDRELDADIARGSSRRQDERAANEFVTLAKAAGVGFRNEFKISLLDRMSDGRPHNGLILEASRIPAPPVLSLGTPDRRTSMVPMSLAQQSREDAEVNGTPRHIESIGQTWRHPLVVLVDGIVDPGNLGNIIRTCYFYGVDAVAVATNTCANLSSGVLAKASSGACEAMCLLSLPQPSNFAYESARNGWKIYASVAPPSDKGPAMQKVKHFNTEDIAVKSPLAKHPCILMLGAEGQGLRENLINRANATVSIEGSIKAKDTPDIGVDSINVSVAAGVLLDSFLRKPAEAPEKKDTSAELGW